MYNGIGLTTPRGSGTNGHVQRNWALVRPKEKEKTYRTEENLAKLDALNVRQPNKEILDHERKRKIELKCAEFAEILEDQGFTDETVKNKVNNYRIMLMGHDGKLDRPIGHWARVSVTETHQLAEAQQEKNAKLREAFGISEYFVDGSSFDPDRQAKEEIARSTAIQEKEKQKALEREKEKEQEKALAARYELVHTPTPEPPELDTKKKKKHKSKDSSSSEEHRKKKKSKKRKKERSVKCKDKKKRSKHKHSVNSSDSDESDSSESEDSLSEDEKRKRKKLKKKEKKKSSKKKRSSSDSSHNSSPKSPKVEKYGNKITRNNEIYNETRKEHMSLKTKKRHYEKDDHHQDIHSPLSKHSRKSSKRREGSHEADNRSRSRTPDKNQHRNNYGKYRENDSTYHSSRNEKSKTEENRQSKNSKSINYKRRSRSNSPNYNNRVEFKHDRQERQRSRSNDSKLSKRQRRSLSPYQNTPPYSLDKYKHKNSYSENKSSKQELLQAKERSPETKFKSTDSKSKTDSSNRDNRLKQNDISESRRKLESGRKSPKRSVDREYTSQNRNNRYVDEKFISRKASPDNSKSYEDRSKDCYKKSYKRERSNSSNKLPDNKDDDKTTSTHRYPENHKHRSRTPLTRNSKSKTPPKSLLFRSRSTHSKSSADSPTHLSQIKTPPRNFQKSNGDSKKINEKSPRRKNLQQMPVVRLRSSSEEEKSDDDNDNVDEEREKELRMLRLLKSGLAAKAKEVLEKKIPKLKPENEFNIEKIVSPKIVEQTHIDMNAFDIKVLPLKSDIIERKKTDDLTENLKDKVKANIIADEFLLNKREKSVVKKSLSNSRSRSKSRSVSNSAQSKVPESKHRSSSRSSYSRSRSSSSSSSRSGTRSASHVRSSRSRSKSSSRSSSSGSSRSRSPSIPRRHGSPSFLDRRRITSWKM